MLSFFFVCTTLAWPTTTPARPQWLSPNHTRLRPPPATTTTSSPLPVPASFNRKQKKHALVADAAERLLAGDAAAQILAARDVRKLAKSSPSTRSSLAADGVVRPLVDMLASPLLAAREASLLAILNLAVRNERNKELIVAAGAVPYLVELLKCEHGSLRDSATAAILTLSASAPSKPEISSSGVLPLLVQILSTGNVQGKVDAVTALFYLSSCAHSLMPGLANLAVPPLLSLLRDSKKHTKFAEKTTALLERFSEFEEGRTSITIADGGILTLVETIEDGSVISAQHAVATLLVLLQSSRSKYRELILKEGAIPGLLQLTAHGTPKAQEQSRILLQLLRDSPPSRRLDAAVIKSIVYDIAKQVENTEKDAETATKLLREIVHRSMELSLNGMHINSGISKLRNGVNSVKY